MRVSKRFVMGAAMAVLAGCAGLSGWAKEGADEEAVRADLRECRTIANNLTDRDRQIDRDIRAARGSSRGINENAALLTDVREYGNERRSDDLVSRCMRSRGYVRGGSTPETG